MENVDYRSLDRDLENSGAKPTALQSEAARALSSSTPDTGVHNRTGNTSNHSDSQLSGPAPFRTHMDEYKDRISRLLDEAQKEAAGNHTTGDNQGRGHRRPHFDRLSYASESAETTALENKLKQDIAGLNDTEKDQFVSNLEIFLDRASKQGLDEKSQVDGTLIACDRLLKPGENELFLDNLFNKENGEHLRTILAEQIMAAAAYPSQTNQGRFGTCPVTSLETHIWFDKPSVAASLIADQALNGQWVSTDGHVVKLPQMDFVSDKYSDQATPPDGQRNYAGQLFQATALSDVLSRQATPQYYATGGITRNENGHEVGIEYLSDQNGKKTGEYEGLEDVPDAQELKRLDGANTEVLSADPSEAGADANVVIFNGKEDLKAKLTEAQENGKMPVIINVASNDSFFGPSDPKDGHALDHDICVDKYDPETGNLVIDNQWGSKFDWGTKSVMGSPSDVNPVVNIDKFFPATQGAVDHGSSH